MVYLFDTSVWVALFLENDTHHEEALGIWQKLDGQALLPYIVVAETASVLTYKHSKQQADKFLRFILESPRIALFQNQLQMEIPFFLHFKQRLSFADYAVLHLARIENCPLITFDAQMKSLQGRIGDE